MKINVLQKNGNFSGLEFFPEDSFEAIQLHQITEQLNKLNKIIIKHRIVEEIKDESLIMRMVR